MIVPLTLVGHSQYSKQQEMEKILKQPVDKERHHLLSSISFSALLAEIHLSSNSTNTCLALCNY